ncbi:MAG: hypothetical protein F6K41_28940 [Symploca sp. SIO3E6]|nr:hypothetical protein [Caldora sp. SIO3E6]
MIPIPSRDFNDKFYTFLIPMGGDNRQICFRWRTETALKQNFSFYQAAEESFWVLCQGQDDYSIVRKFLEIYQHEETTERDKELAKWHLTAYLETPCYQAASKRFATFSNFNDLTDDWEYYLHLARCLTNNPEEILRIYRKYRRRGYDLEKHFMWEIASKIRDLSYQATGQGKYSPWYSLKNTSASTLTQALFNHGVRQENIERYLVVKSCLFEVYAKSEQGRWLAPTINEYQAAANYCTRYHFTIDFLKIQKLITICLEVLRSSPKFISCGTDNNLDVIENHSVNDISEPDPLLAIAEDLSREKMQSYAEGINQVLTQGWSAFKQRDIDHETMLLLRYGLGLSQASTAAQIGVHQTTVREHCLQFQEQLLEAVGIWLIERLGINLQQLENVDKYLDYWVQQQYKKQIDSVIMAGFNNYLEVDSRNMLTQMYFNYTKERKLARQLNIGTAEFKQKVKEAENQLLLYLLEWVKDTVGIFLENKLERKKVARLIKEWLSN